MSPFQALRARWHWFPRSESQAGRRKSQSRGACVALLVTMIRPPEISSVSACDPQEELSESEVERCRARRLSGVPIRPRGKPAAISDEFASGYLRQAIVHDRRGRDAVDADALGASSLARCPVSITMPAFDAA